MNDEPDVWWVTEIGDGMSVRLIVPEMDMRMTPEQARRLANALMVAARQAKEPT